MVAVSPTLFLEHNLDPISKAIDGYGGAHVLMGLIAAGGEPHVYVTGNLQGRPTLQKEIHEALAAKLLEMVEQGETKATSLIMP